MSFINSGEYSFGGIGETVFVEHVPGELHFDFPHKGLGYESEALQPFELHAGGKIILLDNQQISSNPPKYPIKFINMGGFVVNFENEKSFSVFQYDVNITIQFTKTPG